MVGTRNQRSDRPPIHGNTLVWAVLFGLLVAVIVLGLHGEVALSAELSAPKDKDLSAGEKNMALVFAAMKGNLEEVKRLVTAGADVNALVDHGIWGSRPLIDAASGGWLPLVRFLLESGADIDAADNSGRTALSYAAELDDRDVAEFLRSSGAKVTLMDACALGDLKTATRLLDGGADPNVMRVYGIEDQYPPLWVAAAKGYLNLCRLLLDRGADVDQGSESTGFGGNTPIMAAAARGHVEVLKFLLERGADINSEDVHGFNALMCAAGANQVEAARVLLARGMKREGVVKGLLYAAARGSIDVINLIMNSGVPVDSTTEDGVTGLMFASSYNQLDAARLLLDKGAKVDWKDRADETALGLAKSREMRQLLLDRGASNR